MRARFLALYSSLGIRLLVPLFLTVGGVLAVYALSSFRSTQEHFLAYVAGEAERSSGLIRRATHDGMLLNRLDEVQATIERIAEGSDVAAIRVYDKAGTVVLSSERGELGRRIPVDAAPCSSCHGEGEPLAGADREASDMTRFGEQEVLRRLSAIENEPACSTGGCHDQSAQAAVLGILDVEMSMLPLESALESARSQMIWTTLALLLVTGLVSAVLVRRLVHEPIARLQDGTRRIAGGDLATRIEVRGGHELARLAADFNRMAEDLSGTQREVARWSQTLEEKVVEKTAELQQAQRQVLHMEKMSSLGKLSATVAHELNNPLSGVLTYARLVERELEEQPLDDEVRVKLERYLHLVQRESARCGGIVQNLLMFARGTVADMAVVDLNEIVDRSLMLVRHHLEISGIALETEFLDADSEVIADAGQIQQALVALFVNAVEAMREGGTLTVRLRGGPMDVRVEVRDTGVGIPPDVQPQIFEPFFSTKDNEAGVGLGLAVVYGILHRHGGFIEVESEVGTGTTFHIWLPRTPPAEGSDVWRPSGIERVEGAGR
ncbi:MAG TPA: ATP-binding protein [Longimicrobiales bacterium]